MYIAVCTKCLEKRNLWPPHYQRKEKGKRNAYGLNNLIVEDLLLKGVIIVLLNVGQEIGGQITEMFYEKLHPTTRGMESHGKKIL